MIHVALWIRSVVVFCSDACVQGARGVSLACGWRLKAAVAQHWQLSRSSILPIFASNINHKVSASQHCCKIQHLCKMQRCCKIQIVAPRNGVERYNSVKGYNGVVKNTTLYLITRCVLQRGYLTTCPLPPQTNTKYLKLNAKFLLV